MLLSLCFLFGERTNFLCAGFALLDIVGDTLTFMYLYYYYYYSALFTTTYVKIKTINNETVDVKAIWRNICSEIIVIISLLVLWVLTEPPKQESKTFIDNGKIYEYSYCGLSDFTISFFIAEYIVIAFGLLLSIKLWYIEKSTEIFLLIFQITAICVKSLIYSILFIAYHDESETVIDNLYFIFDYFYIFLSLSSLVVVKIYTDPKHNSKVASDTKISNTKELERFSKLLLDHIYMVHFDMFLREYNLNYYTDFVEHVFKYRNLTDPSGSSELLKKIYHNYIMEDASNPISLSEETRNTIKKHLDNNELDNSLYDDSLLEALQYLYKHNYIDQFKRSKYIPMIEKSNKILKYFESLTPAVLHGVVESMKRSLEETETKEVDITKSSNTNIINSKSIVGVGNGSICNRNQLSTVNMNQSQAARALQDSSAIATPTTVPNPSAQQLVQPTQNPSQQQQHEKISQHTTSITGHSSTSNSAGSHNNVNVNNINTPGVVTSLNEEDKSDKYITGTETFSNE